MWAAIIKIGVVLGLVFGAAFAVNGWLDARDALAYDRGYHDRDVVAVKEESERRAVLIQRTAENIASARKIDAEIVTRLQRQNQAFASAQKDLELRLEVQEQTPYVFNKEKPNEKPLVAQSVLDDRTVGVLNAARAGPVRVDADGRATLGSDAQGPTPAYSGRTVTGRELVLNDLEVTRLYRELAINHDALVDWVEGYCAIPKK